MLDLGWLFSCATVDLATFSSPVFSLKADLQIASTHRPSCVVHKLFFLVCTDRRGILGTPERFAFATYSPPFCAQVIKAGSPWFNVSALVGACLGVLSVAALMEVSSIPFLLRVRLLPCRVESQRRVLDAFGLQFPLSQSEFRDYSLRFSSPSLMFLMRLSWGSGGQLAPS